MKEIAALSGPESSNDIPRERWLFVTGRLAEGVVRQVVSDLSAKAGITADVHVVGISVAALMHVEWLKRKLAVDQHYDRVIIPGWCQGDLQALNEHFGLPFVRGPKDILDLANFLGAEQRPPIDLTPFDIQIIAEINHAPQFDVREILRQALEYRAAGADWIDIGCIPGTTWKDVGNVVRELTAAGLRVSIDSFDREEVEAAVAAGAELVLSCNQSNVAWASQLGAELVVIPDDPHRLETMWETARRLDDAGTPYRLDPILEPIGFGFAASLARYYETRRIAPDTAIMMGIGNVTELSEVDSAGVNFLLAALCQELKIHSVLTTQVINWCRTAVAEFDQARRLVKYAIDHQTPPKRLSHELVVLRDPRLQELGDETLTQLAGQLKDPNFRIFVERGEIHVMNRDGYWQGRDPYELFDNFHTTGADLDAPHAFYLGYELSKAVTALTLGKQYQQDQALRWGFLTIPEVSAHERRKAGEQRKDVQ
ncbi:DUF6513 domain-containing protein [Planctomicrobium sp. SH661]|uniref:DUF6513 domain-containing protein n=1 Tax=Planctomicrobium sp. SH661 TaxID=3448124 RepID=UPI003F5B5805